AADQHDRARYESTAEHTVQLSQAAFDALDLADVEAVQPRELDLARVMYSFRPILDRTRFDDTVPRSAVGTLPLPLRLLASAGFAGVYRFHSCHGAQNSGNLGRAKRRKRASLSRFRFPCRQSC